MTSHRIPELQKEHCHTCKLSCRTLFSCQCSQFCLACTYATCHIHAYTTGPEIFCRKCCSSQQEKYWCVMMDLPCMISDEKCDLFTKGILIMDKEAQRYRIVPLCDFNEQWFKNRHSRRRRPSSSSQVYACEWFGPNRCYARVICLHPGHVSGITTPSVANSNAKKSSINTTFDYVRFSYASIPTI